MAVPRLAVREVLAHAGAPSIWILHGLLGRGRTWATFARRFAKTGQVGPIMLPDLRGHGGSMAAAWPRPHSMAAAACDVLAAIGRRQHAVGGIIGHSLGGKILLAAVQLAGLLEQDAGTSSSAGNALDAALHAREDADSVRAGVALLRERGPCPLSLTIVDTMPGAFHTRGADDTDLDSVGRLLDLATVLPHPASKDEVRAAGRDAGVPKHTTEMFLSCLERGPTPGDPSMRWSFDPCLAEALLSEHDRTDLWGVLHECAQLSRASTEALPRPLRVQLVVAERSSRWSMPIAAENLSRLEAHARDPGLDGPSALRVVRVDAGHWVHVQRPHDIIDLVLSSQCIL